MGQAKSFKARVMEKENLAGNYWWLRLQPEKEIKYKTGQYVSMKVNDKGERRSYSIASWPQKEGLEFLVDVTPMGIGSKYILGIKRGDEVELLGPLGKFMVEEEHLREGVKGFLFVGTGCGIVPLRSMIHDLLEAGNEKRPVRLYWGMRYERDLFWKEELEELEEKYGNFKKEVVLSREENWPGRKGHVQDFLREDKDNWQGWQAYVCGNKQVIKSVEELLVEMGIEKEAVHFEKFY